MGFPLLFGVIRPRPTTISSLFLFSVVARTNQQSQRVVRGSENGDPKANSTSTTTAATIATTTSATPSILRLV